MKKILSFILALFLSFTACLSPISEASTTNTEPLQAAQQLYNLGLFRGVGVNADGTPDFDLDRAPTRAEAVVMLVRLFMDEEAALQGYELEEYFCPFTDVVEWAKPYIAYAYAHGLTNGQSETTFGCNSPVAASEYLTFVLRAMGYKSGTDFQWDRAWELSDQLGITDGRYKEAYAFTRGDVAIVSLNVLKKYKTVQIYSIWNAPSNLEVISRYEWDGLNPYLTLTPIAPVSNFCIVEFEMTEDTENFSFSISGIPLYVGDIIPGQAVEASLYTGEFMPAMGYAYTDQDGMDHVFYIGESGRDGSLFASSAMIEQKIPPISQ